jgi:hypothetical protein
MFCANCGQEVSADKSFCTNCGAPAPKQDTPPATAQDAAPAAQNAAQPQFVPPVAEDAPAAWQPPAASPGGPVRPRRSGLIVGSVAAVVVVLAGAGVGIWLALKGDDGGAVSEVTTTVVDEAATTLTIPGLSGADGGSANNAPQTDGLADFRVAVEDVLRELDFAHGRIPELADIINSTTPDIPQGVLDDLQVMRDRLQSAYEQLGALAPPAAYEEANSYLLEAVSHMLLRITATMNGVQTTWDTGSTIAARPYYEEGRNERDAYLAAIEDFYELVPQGTLPGD